MYSTSCSRHHALDCVTIINAECVKFLVQIIILSLITTKRIYGSVSYVSVCVCVCVCVHVLTNSIYLYRYSLVQPHPWNLIALGSAVKPIPILHILDADMNP